MELKVSIWNWQKVPTKGNDVSVAHSLPTLLCVPEKFCLGQKEDTIRN